MKIAVIGAGIVGITTAYELACDGHEVTVLERRGAAAEESSFATAGLVGPGYVTPWADPGMPMAVLRHWFIRGGTVKVGWPRSARELTWLWKSFRACKLDTYLADRAQLQQLALYSRERLHQISAGAQFDYERSDGCVVLLRSERDSKLMQPGLQLLRDAGVAFQEISPAQARQIENALNPDTAFFGAIHLPDDEVVNCRQFALLLKNEAQRIGVKFLFGTQVTRLTPVPGVALDIEGQSDAQTYDACVICAGCDSVRLLAPLGIKIPLAAVHRYSVSASIREPLNAPRSAVIDERYKVTISRLGNRVRVAGGAELGGAVNVKHARSLQTLYKVLHDWFPGAANMSGAVQEWKGACPTLPGGPPLIGASGVGAVWLNLGHGDSGWALSCGSARVLADLIGGRQPAVDMTRASGLKSSSEWVDTTPV